MSASARIGAAEAAAILAEARAIGETITLTRPTIGDVDLYVLLEENLGAETVGLFRAGGGRRVQKGKLSITIPNQTGFAAAMTNDQRPIREGHRIEFPVDSGRYFFVDPEPESIRKASHGYVYHVQATEDKTATVGARA